MHVDSLSYYCKPRPGIHTRQEVAGLLPVSYVIHDSHLTGSRKLNLVIRHGISFLLLFIVKR